MSIVQGAPCDLPDVSDLPEVTINLKATFKSKTEVLGLLLMLFFAGGEGFKF